MIYMSERSARNFMRYTLRGFYYNPDNPWATDVARMRFYQIDPAILTDPVKMAALKLAAHCTTTTMGAGFVEIGWLYATMAYDESLNLIRVKSIDVENQAAKNIGIGTANFCLVSFGGYDYNKFVDGYTGTPVACGPVAGLPVGAGRPVELASGGVFTAVGQPLKLKTFALRLKGY